MAPRCLADGEFRMSFLDVYQLEAKDMLELCADQRRPISEAVMAVRTFALRNGFDVTAKWMDLELKSYRPGPGRGPVTTGELLGVPADHPLIARIAGYRIIEGRIFLRTPTQPIIPLPVYNLECSSVTEIETALARPEHRFASARVPFENLPNHEITRQIERQAKSRGLRSIEVRFERAAFIKLLAGFRREILVTVSDCLAGTVPA